MRRRRWKKKKKKKEREEKKEEPEMDAADASSAAHLQRVASSGGEEAYWLPCVYVIVLEDRGGGYIIAQTSPENGFTIAHVDGGTGVLRQWPRPGKQFASLEDAETEIGFPGRLTSHRIQVGRSFIVYGFYVPGYVLLFKKEEREREREREIGRALWMEPFKRDDRTKP